MIAIGTFGAIIKYNTEGKAEWAKAIGIYDTKINSIIETKNGDYVVGGIRYFHDILDLGDDIVLPDHDEYAWNAMLIKFKPTEIANPVVKQSKLTAKGTTYERGNRIESVAKTQDGGYITAGNFSTDLDLGNGQTLTNNGKEDDMLIKYNHEDEIEWTKVIESDAIRAIIQTQDGGYLVGGYSEETIDLGNGFTTKSGMLIKYNNQMEVEWAQSIPAYYGIISVQETKDGGYLVGGDYKGKKVDLGNEVIAYANDGTGALIAKYNHKGEAQWVKLLESTGSAKITSAIETSDGGYVVSGFFSKNLKIENDIEFNSVSEVWNGMIIKYDEEGNFEWNKVYPTSYNNFQISPKVTETQDGGYAIGITLSFKGKLYLDNGISITAEGDNYYNSNIGALIKYNSKGETQWAKSIQQGINPTYISGVQETKNGELIVIGQTCASKIELENGVVINPKKEQRGYRGIIVKYDSQGKAKWAKNIGTDIGSITELEYGTYAVGGFSGQDALVAKIEENNAGIEELEIENNRKEFAITTKVEKKDDIAGGSISGENEEPYEIVKYGDSNKKEIKMIPEEGYEILKVTINGEEATYEKAEDGSCTIPTFTEMKENKNIVVTYTLADSKLTIHKVDQENKQPLEGATFNIEKINENSNEKDLENALGGLNQKNIEDPNFSGMGLYRNQMHYFEKVDNKYIATNSNAYQISTTTANTTANSLMPIDLTGKTGKYRIEVNAQIDSQEGIGIGYATVSDSSSAPSYDKQEGRFMYLTGNVSAQNYTYELEGGNRYFLHVGYAKGEADTAYSDDMTINSVKIYQPDYSFVEIDGKYQLKKEVGGQKSYLPIDLTNHDGSYMLKVNAEIASENKRDIGYVMITESEEIPEYDAERAFINLSGEQEAKDYTITLQGGKMYYLYLGYSKTRNTPIENEKFIINKVEVKPYSVEVTTNTEGQGSAQIPFGKYKIVETKAPKGYLRKEEPTEIEFTAEGEHEITIENTKSSKVMVHHYLKGTRQEVAKDEIIEGKEGEAYVTAPQMDLEKYVLEKDSQDKFVIPENATGKYTVEDIEVTYEYIEKKIPLTIHHYIEGTTQKVPLANGAEAEDVKQNGKEGEGYTTNPIAENELSAQYELAQIPVNRTGIYSESEISVTYYYKKVERDLILTKYQEDGITPLAGAKFTILDKKAQNEGQAVQEKVYTTNGQGELETTLGYGAYEVKEIEAPKGYVLPENPTTEIIITKDIKNKQLNITNEKEKGTVIVHYYVEGTKEKVPLADGTLAEDVVITGEIGSIYATKEIMNVSKKYEFKSIPTNASGFIKKGTTEVIYYYKAKDNPVMQNAKIIKTSEKQKVIKADEKIPYTITYTGTLDKYKGDAIVTIVDQLPYEIELAEGKSNLAGGIYDAKNKTITWSEKIEGMDTYTDGKRQINITKSIELTYKNLDVNTESLSNKVTGEIRLLDIEEENPTDPVDPIGKTEETNNIPIDVLTKMEVKLIWVEAEEERDLRPENLILQVKKEEEVITSKQIAITKEEASHTALFEKLPKYDEQGNLIKYTVDETVLPGEEHKDDLQYYKKTIEGSTITNTIDRSMIKKEGKVTVQHIDKKTGKILKTIVKTGEIGDICKTEEEQIDGYELLEAPEEPNITITESNQTITYYYERIPSAIIEKHIDRNTNEVLYSKTHIGQKGDKYKTEPKTLEGYDVVTIPTNAEGEITLDTIEVEYYYIRKASVTVQYLDKETGAKIIEDVKITGHENDNYTTQKKDIKGYVLAGNPTNQNGKMKVTKNPDGTYETQTLVQYYYTKKQLQVIEEYVNIADNTVIETIIHKGVIGDEYKIDPKEIEGYELVQKDEKGNSLLPSNHKGTITEDRITVRYYYKKKTKVIVKYLDQLTKEELGAEEIKGYVGDSYQTKERQWEGYDLVETAKNATGKMSAATIEVKYYYRRKTQVEVQYLEKETNQVLSEKETINGYVGEKYKTLRKGIACYKYVESTGNEEGFMTKDKIIVKYYFEKQEFNLKVDTWISNVVMNGASKGGKTLRSKDDIYKLDIHRKQVNSAEIKVTYTIRISNIGETEGSVLTLTDAIPSGFSYHQEDNQITWSKAGEILTTTEMKGQIIKPGENREITLVLRWNKGEENLKEKINTVTLSKTQSLAGFDENHQEDNVATAKMLITIATGMSDEKDRVTIITTILAILTVILGALVYSKRRYYHKR